MKNLRLRLLIFFLSVSWSHGVGVKPNFILMMGDDHGWEETGYNGHPHVKTPELDQMAAVGLRFDRFHSGHANCSPTRASFLTGRHPNRMGTFAPGWSFRPEEMTLGHILGDAGYRCGHFGKWHVGPVKKESPVCPGAMGFHEWLSHDNFFEMNPVFSRNGAAPEVFPGESSKVLVDEVIEFIRRCRKDDRPFCAVVWFGSPHEPYMALPEDLALYDDLPAKFSKPVDLTSIQTGSKVTRPQGEVLRERYAEITAMDREIGRLRRFLTSEKLRQNTALFYCGDNGTSPDSALGFPHRGRKGDIYEGGTMVPGLLEWPERFGQPHTVRMHASTLDLLPSIAACVGRPLPSRPMDGIDLFQAVESAREERPKPLFFWQYNEARTARGSREPYIDPELQKGTTPLLKKMGGKATRDFVNYRHPTVEEGDYAGPRAVIDGAFKLIAREMKDGMPGYELFNLDTDPAEKHNLASQESNRVNELSMRMKNWQSSVLQSLTGADYQR